MMNAKRIARQLLIAESDGARREREMHELQQQFDAPAFGTPAPDDPRKREKEIRGLEEGYKSPAYKGDRDQEWEYDEGVDDPEMAAEAQHGNALRNVSAMLAVIPGVFDWDEESPESTRAISDFLIRAATPEAGKWLLQLAYKLDALDTAKRGLDKFD